MPKTGSLPRQTLEFQISYSCVQDCSFCSESESIEEFSDHPVSAREIARVLAAKRREGVRHVAFAGAGEPTLHPKFTGVLRAAKGLGLSTSMVSNGWRLAEARYAAQALPYLDEVCLSIHGDTAELHEELTRTPGGFARLLRAFAHVRERRGVYLMSNTVVAQKNKGRIDEIVSFILGLGGVRRVQLSQLLPYGRGADGYAAEVVPYSWWRRKLPGLMRLARGSRAEMWFAGFPLCVLGPYRRQRKDRHFPPTVSVDRARVDGAAGLAETVNRKSGPTLDRVKPPVCAGCAERGDCQGDFKRYVKEFGTAELRPFPKRRHRAARR